MTVTAVCANAPLLHRHLGDRRFLMALPRAVALQILHPRIAAALAQHLHTPLWHHKRRAVSQMIYMAYGSIDPRPVIRFGHEHVKDTTTPGLRYHALGPDLFFFQHATYVDTLVAAINTFSKPLSDREHEQLYVECCHWYEHYGVSTRPMPTTWPKFTEYFAQTCHSQLRRTDHSTLLLRQALHPDTWVPGRLPGFAVRAIQHRRVRELLDIRQSYWETTTFGVYARAVRAGSALLPERLRLVKSARLAGP